ncbi:hypothetical protein D3C71_940550 [compost metagenome]
MPGLTRLRVGRRQRIAGSGQLRLPPIQFVGGGFRACVNIEFVRPSLESAGLRRQFFTLISGLQIFQQHPPRNTVHRQVVDHQQQALRAISLGDQRHAQQRSVLQAEAALGFVAHRLQRGIAGDTGGPEHVNDVGAVGADITRRPLAVDLTEAQTQGIVLLEHTLQGTLQTRQFKGFARCQQHRLVPVCALRDRFFEEPALDRREFLHAIDRPLLGQRRGLFLDHGSQGLQGLLLEQVARLQVEAGTAGATDHLNRDDRVAAQFKEIVLTPDLLHAQHVLPDLRQHLFMAAARCFERTLADLHGRRRQAFAIQFAVGAQRHLFDQHGLRRHHVIRQAAEQMAFQGFAPRALLVGIGADQSTVLRHDVRHQLLAARAVEGQDHGFLHVGMFLQTRFDFPEFDAQAANFHLVVDASAVIDGAIGAIPRQVAGAVQALAAAERVDHETLGSQRTTTVITARQTNAAEVQLTHRAQRQRLQFAVENAGAQIGDRSADRHAVATLFDAGPVGHVDGRFGRAIQVVQVGLRQAAQGLALQFHRQRFATANDPGQRGTGQRFVGTDERREHRRHEVQRGDRLLNDQRGEALRVAMLARCGDHQRRAFHQRPEKLPHRHVETERRLLQHAV